MADFTQIQDGEKFQRLIDRFLGGDPTLDTNELLAVLILAVLNKVK